MLNKAVQMYSGELLVTKDAAIGVRMAGEIKQAAAKAAAADRRSVSSLMEKLLVEYLVSEGYLNSDDENPTMVSANTDKNR